jgi:hypothetical protein
MPLAQGDRFAPVPFLYDINRTKSMKIFVDKARDGVNVRLTRFEEMPNSIDTLVFRATSANDAAKLAYLLADAINGYSTEIAAVQNVERPSE